MGVTTEHEIGEFSSFQQMIDFLSTGDGIDLDRFNETGNKSLQDLHKEVSSRDVLLRIEPKTRRVMRCAQSAKLIIKNPSDKHYLLEVSREFPNGNIVHVRDWVKPFSTFYSLSETRKRGELPILSAIRGVQEELGVYIFDLSELKPISTGDVIDLHESSVYPGLWSYVQNMWFEWTTEQLSTKIDLPTMRDNGVIINREWHPIA